MKDWAIRNFGTNDKLILQLGILAVLALFAPGPRRRPPPPAHGGGGGPGLRGGRGRRRPPAAPTPRASPTPSPPSWGDRRRGAPVSSSSAASWRRSRTRRKPPEAPGAAPARAPQGWDRRGFVIAATATAAASAGAGVLGRVLNGSSGQEAVASCNEHRPAAARLTRPRGAPGAHRSGWRTSARSSRPTATSPGGHRPGGPQGGRHGLAVAHPRRGRHQEKT
ncbi:hypothetical protein LV779_09125 [Streptomyces thinghirensis]|nr:hypothetical protein [Streptomyces thinghirensis]